jgi:predicted transcriptional regulator
MVHCGLLQRRHPQLVLHETSLKVYSESSVGRLEGMFELDRINAEELTLEKWETRPKPVKFFESALKPLRVFG